MKNEPTIKMSSKIAKADLILTHFLKLADFQDSKITYLSAASIIIAHIFYADSTYYMQGTDVKDFIFLNLIVKAPLHFIDDEK